MGEPTAIPELPTGRASLNLMKMARSGLLHELRALIERARKDAVPVSKDGIVIEEGKNQSFVRLEVIPFRTPARDQQHFLVLFEEKELPEVPEQKAFPRQSARRKRTPRVFRLPN